MVGFLIGLSVLWLPLSIFAYTYLRKIMLSPDSSSIERVFFILISSAMLAPGLLSGGHPPPIPIPIPFGALLLEVFSLLNGGHGEEGFFFVIGNLFSWVVVSVIVGLIELLHSSKGEPVSQPMASEGGEIDTIEAQSLRGSLPLEKPVKLHQYIAEFTSTASGKTLYHHAMVDEGSDSLVLSVYEGGPNQPLSLVQTYTAPDWDELSLYLQSRTSFRRGDFHARS